MEELCARATSRDGLRVPRRLTRRYMRTGGSLGVVPEGRRRRVLVSLVEADARADRTGYVQYGDASHVRH